MTEIITPEPKRKAGRPKGATDKKKRTVRTRMQLALDDVNKRSQVTTAFLSELAKMHLESERLDFCINEYKRLQVHQREQKKALTRAIKAMAKKKAHTAANRVLLNAYIPVDLMHEFNNIIDECPLNKSEIITNLILNYIKAHKGFSKADLQAIDTGVKNLERQSYKNTKIAAEMLSAAPYDAIKHVNPGSTKQTALDQNENDVRYAAAVDKPYVRDDVIKALEKDGSVDMSELFEE